MDEVEVLVIANAPDAALERIARVDQRVNVIDARIAFSDLIDNTVRHLRKDQSLYAFHQRALAAILSQRERGGSDSNQENCFKSKMRTLLQRHGHAIRTITANDCKS